MRKRTSEIFALTGRNIKEIVRDPVSLIFLLALPLVMEVMFYYLFHGMTSQFAMKYLAPGIVVFSEAFLALFSGLLIATDRNTSFLTRLYVTGAKSYQFIFGYALAMIPVALVQSILFFLVGGIIDSSIFGAGMILGILTSVFTSLFYIGLGILFGSVCSEKSVGGIASVAV
ncbi:MAG: ABC transporter permease, partial [Clostridia bacterium]|nr:ABC transporter permease [Clostridia bacterium]